MVPALFDFAYSTLLSKRYHLFSICIFDDVVLFDDHFFASPDQICETSRPDLHFHNVPHCRISRRTPQSLQGKVPYLQFCQWKKAGACCHYCVLYLFGAVYLPHFFQYTSSTHFLLVRPQWRRISSDHSPKAADLQFPTLLSSTFRIWPSTLDVTCLYFSTRRSKLRTCFLPCCGILLHPRKPQKCHHISSMIGAAMAPGHVTI